MILGYNVNEGFMALADAHKNNKYAKFDQDLASRIPQSIALNDNDPKIVELTEDIRRFYFDGQTLTEKMKAPVAKFLGDYHFIIDIHLLAETYARQQHK